MPAPSFETLLYDVEDGIATITLHRPDKLNAFNPVMMQDLIDVFDVTDADDAVKAVIVTGHGKAFCAGQTFQAGPTPSRRRPRAPAKRSPATPPDA